jgi:hypothetical protein
LQGVYGFCHPKKTRDKFLPALQRLLDWEGCSVLQRRLRFSDLVDLNIVQNRTTLRNWQRDRGFPLGQRTGNIRTWGEDEIGRWQAAQPTEKKPAPVVAKGRRGRPRNPLAGVEA